ncbi:MAG TPA: FAD binding domain-containing protein [Streptosporangiaceae bacterium]|nr:FAD binding domain-containing protein [Streptosporangiaceae bacterium]
MAYRSGHSTGLTLAGSDRRGPVPAKPDSGHGGADPVTLVRLAGWISTSPRHLGGAGRAGQVGNYVRERQNAGAGRAGLSPSAGMKGEPGDVKPSPFGYSRPESVAEALAVLGSLGPDGKVLAGGQSLIPLLSMRLAAPAYLVDINRLTELSYVRVQDGQVAVGALARHADVLRDPAAASAQPLLARALALVAHPVIRNRGTTVGSIVHADPAAEMTAVIALLGGSVRLAGPAGERVVLAGDFFLGPLESDVRHGELAIEAMFPVLPAAAGCAFAEVSRRHGDYAICGVAAVVQLDGAGLISRASAAYLSVAPRPLVLDLTEACCAIRGGVTALGAAPAAGAAGAGGAGEADAPDTGAADMVGGLRPDFAPAARLAMARLDPEPDIHATADYRRHLAGVLTEQALTGALSDARERTHA